jgi:hypothetical protein
MVAEVLAGLGAFKTMFDMAKALKDINDAAIRNGAVIELQEQILGAQVAQAALLERVGHLEAEITRFETWETEKQRYTLEKFDPGVVAYALRPETANGEPSHELCANCYSKRRKSILQATDELRMRRRVRLCPSCKTQYAYGTNSPRTARASYHRIRSVCGDIRKAHAVTVCSRRNRRNTCRTTPSPCH